VKPTATIRTVPEDFLVEEVPLYEPSGQGAHLFLHIRKTGLTTFDCVNALASAFRVAPQDIGYAGLKDKHAITTQTLSVPWPEHVTAPPPSVRFPGLEVLDAKRHGNKLRAGHLLANRFRLVLRRIARKDLDVVVNTLRDVARQGVPNAFGPQRFGRDGDNPARALVWLRGETRPPRDPRQRKLLFSSVQAWLFDLVLAQRLAEGTWNTVVRGDVVKTRSHGGLFTCEDEQTDAARAQRGEVTATGPIYGAKMRWPTGVPERLEREILERHLGAPSLLEATTKLGAGSRRPLRILPENLSVQTLPSETDPEEGALEVQLTLPKGAYATTLLATACELRDASDRRHAAPNGGNLASSHDELSHDSQPASG
jgi:tRNA pseudouridine13 synthase